MGKLSNIKTRNELAVHLGISKRQLTYILYVRKVESFYHTFSISKKSGGIRTICAPQGRLKILQKKILCLLTEHVSELNQKRYNKVSHAFEKGKGIISNSKVHRNKRFVINIDLEHFFDSFHFGRVCGYFEKNRDFQLAHNVALDLARLLCYRGCLPQGAPTSPIVANLICQTLDMHLLQISKKYHLDYTRYADDLTFSTNDKNFLKLQEDFIKELQQEILRSGFRINSNKTRLQYRESQQKVTGLVVNKKINVARDYYKQTRAMADKLYKDGVFYINEKRGTIGQLEGRFSFIDQLCKYNNKQDHQKHTFRNLNGREEEYRKFLFYKYFFYSDKPVIVTEGKTDSRYIRAALKNLFSEYPELITKEEHVYTYQVSFLRRTNRLDYFFNYSVDGADAMMNLYEFFNDNHYLGYVNYLKLFSKLSGKKPRNPVIFLFDNELEDNTKPISKFMSKLSDKSLLTKLKQEQYVKLTKEGNLYLVTLPLQIGQNQCEIENLFLDDLLSKELGGKRFCLSGQYDRSEAFGKDTFSKYILEHYQDIDFQRFKPVLDNFKLIIKNYKMD